MAIDWHGENAKQKREAAVRRTAIRAFTIGAILAVLALGGLVVFIQSQPPPTTVTIIVSATPAPTATRNPLLATAQEAIARTDIAFAQTSGAPTRTPTTAPTVSGAQPPSTLPDQLAQYHYDAGLPVAQQLSFQAWLPISAKPGYHLLGARFGQHGLLYIAHARSELLTSCNAPANADDAYWMVDTRQTPAKIVGQLRYPMMVSPKRIALDSQNNAYVLAADCKQNSYAVFKFNAQNQWVDTFPIIGGSDLATTADNKLFVALTGYADSTVPQAHLIELTSDPTTGDLKQIAQVTSGNPAGFYRALLADPAQISTLFAVWNEPKVPERLAQLALNTDSTPAASDVNGLKTVDTSQGSVVPALDNLISVDGQWFGLSLTRRAIVRFMAQPAADQVMSIPFSRIYGRTFAVSGDTWILAGPPDVVPKNTTP